MPDTEHDPVSHLTVDGVTLPYRDTGAGDTLVLIYPGGSDSAPASAALLARYRRVVSFGFLDILAASGSRAGDLPALARLLSLAVSEVSAGPPAILGESLAARVAVHIAVARGATRVVLSAPTDAAADATLAAGLSLPPEALSQAGHILASDARDQLDADLSASEIPVLILSGSDDDTVPGSVGSGYITRMPAAALIVVYAAGHDIAADRPDAYARVVGDFLARGSGFIRAAKPALAHP